MLNSKGFDLWADDYDKSVGVSEEENRYPFAGYKKILGDIYKIIMEKPDAVVLDLGFGTGTLTTKLYENGCTIYGQDFSSRMIELACEKMPGAHLYQGDFSKGLADELKQESFDFIIAKDCFAKRFAYTSESRRKNSNWRCRFFESQGIGSMQKRICG